MSKGSTQRPTDKDKFDSNFEAIFRKDKQIDPQNRLSQYIKQIEDADRRQLHGVL